MANLISGNLSGLSVCIRGARDRMDDLFIFCKPFLSRVVTATEARTRAFLSDICTNPLKEIIGVGTMEIRVRSWANGLSTRLLCCAIPTFDPTIRHVFFSSSLCWLFRKRTAASTPAQQNPGRFATKASFEDYGILQCASISS